MLVACCVLTLSFSYVWMLLFFHPHDIVSSKNIYVFLKAKPEFEFKCDWCWCALPWAPQATPCNRPILTEAEVRNYWVLRQGLQWSFKSNRWQTHTICRGEIEMLFILDDLGCIGNNTELSHICWVGIWSRYVKHSIKLCLVLVTSDTMFVCATITKHETPEYMVLYSTVFRDSPRRLVFF